MAKGKKRKTAIRCLGCGAKMRKRAVACWECGKARPGSFEMQASAAKAVFRPVGGPAFVAKSARPRCGRCSQTSGPGSRHCTTCGAALLTVVKSAAEQQRDVMLARFRAEDNPESREAYWKAAHPHIYGNGGTAS